MTEEEARAWIVDRHGSAAEGRIATFLARLVEENAIQNLISPGSLDTVWARHVVDSAQLLTLAPCSWSSWLDIGTGGGFPGMIVALLAPRKSVLMLEPRSRRAAFLKASINEAELGMAAVVARKVESITHSADVISARAVAQVGKLLPAAMHCAKADTVWLLPRGRSGRDEFAGLNSGLFHVEHSITDPQSLILVGHGPMR